MITCKMNYIELTGFIGLCLISNFVFAFPRYSGRAQDDICGYESCHPVKNGYVNVHIVPHSHDDVGWLKTVDQYFYGANSAIQKAGVQYILDTVTDSLTRNEDRRFIYVETAFFWKWWLEQDEDRQNLVKNFVNNGRLEFISGGWCMNDEAATHYQSTIDQMSWGLRKLNDAFGECGRPKLGWQIDPFGHSRETASIFAQLGFDGLLLGRIDYQDKSHRFGTKTPEMVWKTSANLESSDLFTGVMYNTYSPPPGFCFDILCDDEPIIDNKKSFDYNVDRKVDDFFAYLDNVTNAYATNNVIITMGMDFNYQDAEAWFKNLDKLIKYSNQRQPDGSRYNLIYSTPSCYVKAIYDETKGKFNFSVKEDDFFPYASDPHAYWTGYFSSRPTIKRFEREGNNLLQVCKQLSAQTSTFSDQDNLDSLREAMGIMQHHDAITGTEKQHVANDYAKLLAAAISQCEDTTASALEELIVRPSIPNDLNLSTCPLANISQCALTEKENTFVVTVYNPLSRPVTKYVKLPVVGSSYSVRNSKGEQVAAQLSPIHKLVLSIPGRESNATVELVFAANDIPPLGFESYYVQKQSGDTVLQPKSLKDLESTAVEIDNETGLVSSITTNNFSIPVTQDFLCYRGAVGNNEESENRSSGAYIFRPNGTAIRLTQTASFIAYEGPLTVEIHQTFNDWVSQVIRVYLNEPFVEFNWLVGPIPEGDIDGKEIISRFTTKLNTSSTFYTDSNGRELLKRIRNFRPTWELDLEENESGNYYPVTSKILIKDENEGTEFAVLTDRAQGGSSLEDGQVELMVHRYCKHDDDFGVQEALQETAYNKTLVARGSHFVIAGQISNTESGKTIAAWERDIAQRKLLDSWIFLSTTNEPFESYSSKYNLEYAGLKRSLPDNVQILTLEPWNNTDLLLRLEHVLEKNEDPTLSQPVTVDLNDLFAAFIITSLEETTLGGNQLLSNNTRLHFDTAESIESLVNANYAEMSESEKENRRRWNKDQSLFGNNIRRSVNNVEDDSLLITLKPMQIRTFILHVTRPN